MGLDATDYPIIPDCDSIDQRVDTVQHCLLIRIQTAVPDSAALLSAGCNNKLALRWTGDGSWIPHKPLKSHLRSGK